MDGYQSVRPVELFERRFTFEFGNANYDIADDGQRFLMVQETAPPVTQVPVIINWFDELRRLVPTDP